jgi:hypothetical protein
MVSSNRQPTASSPADDNSSASLGSVLTSCLDLLKVEDTSIRRKAVEFIGNVPLATVNAYGKWITAIKAIADSLAVSDQILTQSQVCDFLTVAAKGVDPKRSGTKAVSDATFHIYVDIMESYNRLTDLVKAHYPRIIVDTISALEKGVDTQGVAVGLYGLERYYQERKESAPLEDPTSAYASGALEVNATIGRKDQKAEFDNELLENLMHITGRSRKDLEASLSALPSIDVRKIRDLASNYKRLQRYTKLTNSSGFKKEVEKDVGRKLTDNQLQHAVNSIRKANSYIENLLDGKFIPHGTHGINHVKHNLEYGYQLMGFIEPRKRRLG